MIYKSFPVNLSRIDFADDRYRISTRADISPLAESIRSTGLISPLLLQEKEGGELALISGFRRAEACKMLGWAEAEARVTGAETPRPDCIRYAITENAFQRALNPIEISRALCLLQSHFSKPEDLSATAAETGLPGNHSQIRKLLPLCSLPGIIQEGILSESISPVIALELGESAPESRIPFASLFIDLRLSLNKQREILNLTKEIALRDGRTVSEVLEEQDLKNIISDPESDRNLKTRYIRRYLRKRRFPALTAAEEKYEAGVKELKMSKEIRLTPPRDFEGNEYSFTISFRSLSELREHLAELEQITGQPSMSEILS